MNTFAEFLLHVPKLKKMPVPGAKLQLEMAAVERLNELQEENLKRKTPKKASVMMLLYPKNEITHFALIERAVSSGKHSGQIAFPGGKSEKEDVDHAATAQRETMEEIGIPIHQQQIICAGTPLYIPPSNYMVYPYLAFAKAELSFTPQISEVNRVIEIPLRYLLNDNNRSHTVLSTSYMQEVRVPTFQFNNDMVWGATAMILNEFAAMFKV